MISVLEHLSYEEAQGKEGTGKSYSIFIVKGAYNKDDEGLFITKSLDQDEDKNFKLEKGRLMVIMLCFFNKIIFIIIRLQKDAR